MNPRAGNGAVEAAAVVDEQNGLLAHNGLENATRFPQLPQPASAGLRTYNPSRPHLSRAPSWSKEWGPPQDPYGSTIVGKVIGNEGKVVRPSQLIASVRPT